MNMANLYENSLLFSNYLKSSGRSAATQKQYRREVRRFLIWLDRECAAPLPAAGRWSGSVAAPSSRCTLHGLHPDAGSAVKLQRDSLLLYKETLARHYRPATVNTKLAAINLFLAFCGLRELRLPPLRVQPALFRDSSRILTRSDYRRLLAAARSASDARILPMLLTICGLGLRVSELQFVTIEAVRAGAVTIRNKGKTRQVPLPPRLQQFLLGWCAEQGICSGPVVRGRAGMPLDRTGIWRKLKSLAAAAGVDPARLFPHNLRHLFARSYYEQEHDLVSLAGLLGHSRLDTTRIYVLSTGDEQRRKMDALGLL